MPQLILMLLMAGALIWVAGVTAWTIMAAIFALLLVMLIGLAKLLALPFLALAWTFAHPLTILLVIAVAVMMTRSDRRARLYRRRSYYRPSYWRY